MSAEIKKSRKLLAAATIAVLALSILSLSIPVQSQNQADEEEEETATGEFKSEIEAEDTAIKLEIEVDDDAGIPDGSYEVSLDCNSRPEGQENPILTGTLVVEDSEGKVEIEASPLAGDYADCTVTLGEFTRTAGGFSITAAEEEDEEEGERGAGAEVEAEEESEVKVEAKIVGTSSLAKVKVEFTSSSTDKGSLLQEILDKVRLDEETISNALKIETEEDEELKEKLEVKVKIKRGRAEVEFEYKFVIDSTDSEVIAAAIADKLQTLELDEGDIELKVKGKGKSEAEKRESRERATKTAEKAKEDAKAKGKPEFVENIDKAERFFGKSGKAVVGLKIGLESDDIESMSFGSAQLLLIKTGDREPMFRAVINILTDQPAGTLTACLDGQPIGELTTIRASEELGLSIGHLRENLSGVSITIPGTTVDIVEGADCTGTAMLSGSI